MELPDKISISEAHYAIYSKDGATWRELSFLGQFKSPQEAKNGLDQYLSYPENQSAYQEEYRIMLVSTVWATAQDVLWNPPLPEDSDLPF